MNKGKLIVIAGTDGCGKHTQTMLLKENLDKLGFKTETIDFPQYGLKSAGPIEDYLNGLYGSVNEVDAYQASILYAVDRFAASFKIKKWLSEGKFVLCDRYVSANMGHQAGKIDDLNQRDKFLEWLENLEFNIFKIPKPDINILIYLDTDIARKLALNVKKINMDKTKDIHENNSDHMKKAALAFKYVAEKYNWIQVDCCDNNTEMGIKTRDNISNEILNKVKERLE
jgi:dTMP kinase